MNLIYKHTNIISNKSYIGLTSETWRRRWSKHKAAAKLNKGTSRETHFMRAINKYPEESWVHEILESSLSKEKSGVREIYYIELYDTFNKGYNSCRGGFVGREVSEATKIRLSKANKGRKHSKEVCEAAKVRNSGNGNPMFGKAQSKKAKDAVSRRRRGESDPTLRTWVHENGCEEVDITCLHLCDKYPNLMISKLNAIAKKLKNAKGYRIGVSHKGWRLKDE